MTSAVIASFDVTDVLPERWQQAIQLLIDTAARPVHLDGSSSATREAADTQGVDLLVVDGQAVRFRLPWLDGLYRTGDFCRLAREVGGADITSSPDMRSGLNINCLRGRGSRYEWHVDTNPLTGILYVTTLQPGDGGALVFRDDGVDRYPHAGEFILFDAREAEHAVAPLEAAPERIAVVMNYYGADGYVRPADLDAYLYPT